ncbi:MAG: DUF6746 family protein [Gammaproteobacteria bacterium]|nr:DUF6746 family protein [Gammaproteobacteria bacterium]
MIPSARFLLAFILLSGASALHADERVEHFEGKSAETLSEALENFSAYNDKLAAIVERETLSSEDLLEVHRLTYTLENALGKMREEMQTLAETLETVHLASERAQPDTVRSAGRDYLETARKIAD